MGWIDDAKRAKVPDVADALGLSMTRVKGRAVAMGPCPACNAKQRGSSDSRKPVLVRPEGGGWWCAPCAAKGDALDLVAVYLHGRRLPDLDREQRAGVRAWYAEQGWCDPDPEESTTTTTTPRKPPPSAPAAPEPTYPDTAELEALWNAARPVADVPDVADWLDRVRGINAAEVARLHLARALPADADVPSWAYFGRRPWTETGHRCLVPMYDSRGRFRSVRARRVVNNDTPKVLPPRGHATGRLVMANAVALDVLESGNAPSWWPAGETFEAWVSEGDPAFLALSIWADAQLHLRAVFGIISGSWPASSDVADRVPSGAKVVIDTDFNGAGDKYAEDVRSSVAKRCRVTRHQGRRRGDDEHG